MEYAVLQVATEPVSFIHTATLERYSISEAQSVGVAVNAIQPKALSIIMKKRKRSMWHWLLYAVGGLVGLVLLITIIGLCLPKGHVASRWAEFKQPAEKVWDLMADYENTATWRGDISRVERLPDREGRPVWIEHGGDGPLTIERMGAQRPSRMVTRIADEKLPFGGTWTYEISPTPGGCRVTITENGEVYNPIFRFVGRFIIGHTSTMEGYLRAIGGKFGEQVEPKGD
jgi:Polyketide cyclase / dehydrase and lipid transport